MKKLFYGGKIVTLSSPLYANAVAVENGRVIAVGKENDVRKICGECEEINLDGKTLIPGFIDAHSHFSGIANLAHQCSVMNLRTADEVRQKVRDFIAQKGKKPGEWIVARDYDSNILPGKKHFSLATADSFAPSNPIIFVDRSGHSGMFNSLGLKAVGIHNDTPDPDGGKIGRDENGALNGLVFESALSIYRGKVPPYDKTKDEENCFSAFRYYAQRGITTVQEGYTSPYWAELLLRLDSQNKIPLDLYLFPGPINYDKIKDKFCSPTKRVKLGGIKFFIDGSPQLRTALVRTPYLTGETGIKTHSDEEVYNAFCKAGKENRQILVHSNGDGAVEVFLDALEKAEKEYPNLKNLRPVVVHAQLCGIDQLPRIKALGAMPSFFVAHTYHFGDAHLRNLGYERAKNISPTRSASENGITFTFHQDAPVVEANMLETIWCAVNRITREGVTLDGQQISPLEALKAVTINAAYQYFEEKNKGSIEVGKLADFAVLSDDILAVDPMKIKDVKVLATYKEGEKVY